MQLGCISKNFAGVFTALALCTSSTGAIAASGAHTASISPLVALSALGSDASRVALCGAAAVAAAGAAAAAQGAAPGCVLPAVDAAAPPPVVEAPPPFVEPAPVAVGGNAVSPLLLALAGIAAAIGLYYLLKGDDNFDIIFPPFPTSPA